MKFRDPDGDTAKPKGIKSRKYKIDQWMGRPNPSYFVKKSFNHESLLPFDGIEPVQSDWEKLFKPLVNNNTGNANSEKTDIGRKAILEKSLTDKDEKKLDRYFNSIGFLVIHSSKAILRYCKVRIKPIDVFAGSIPFVHNALELFGKKIPETNCYPECLRDMILRDFHKSTLSEYAVNATETKFIRPVYQGKAFTGRTVSPKQTHLIKAPGDTLIYVCDVVRFVSEYRFYVCENKLLGWSHYWADDYIPDLKIVREAVDRISKSEEALPHSYAIDFGVLHNGKTALIEMNEGYSIDSYNIDHETYGKVIHARWQELVA